MKILMTILLTPVFAWGHLERGEFRGFRGDAQEQLCTLEVFLVRPFEEDNEVLTVEYNAGRIMLLKHPPLPISDKRKTRVNEDKLFGSILYLERGSLIIETLTLTLDNKTGRAILMKAEYSRRGENSPFVSYTEVCQDFTESFFY